MNGETLPLFQDLPAPAAEGRRSPAAGPGSEAPRKRAGALGAADPSDRYFATACALAAALKEQSERAAIVEGAARPRHARAGRVTQGAVIDPQRRIGSAICENLLASLHAQVAREAGNRPGATPPGRP